MISGFVDDTNATINFDVTNMPVQDITMNQTCLINGTNSRSPGKVSAAGGSTISTGGRTMKDYEDQLSVLQKENFRLKLRVFHLEEKVSLFGIGSADEDAMKNNIELKVEVDALKKELIEKQELLSQAAKAFELHEEQKEVMSRNQAEYEQSLANERRRIAELEQELEEYKEKSIIEPSIYYKEAFGITPESAIENQGKLHQMEEFVESLEAEIRQLSESLEEERAWAQELEAEREQLRDRLASEVRLREKQISDRDLEIETLRERIKELEEESFKRESTTQQYKNELAEKERVIKEKMVLLEDKCKVCDELSAVVEKRKKQVDQLRASVKSRDDALADSNNKYRTLLNQFENNHRRLSPPSSPSTFDDSQSKSGHLSSRVMSPPRICTSPFDWDNVKERSARTQSQIDSREIKELTKELEERDLKLKKQEEATKQLILKICNEQQASAKREEELKNLKHEHEKALKMIQEFMLRQNRIDEKQAKKEQKILELQHELKRIKSESQKSDHSCHSMSSRRQIKYEINNSTEDNQTQQVQQQRFEEMEAKINDLRDEIETIKAEKTKLEKQIEDESEELQHQLDGKQEQIESIMAEKYKTEMALREKEEKIQQLQEEVNEGRSEGNEEIEQLTRELSTKKIEIQEQNEKIEQLSKDLQVKTQNLQKLVNTELWSKNKEIAKLHNHMTANQSQDRSRNKSELTQECVSTQFNILIKELNTIGIHVNVTEDTVQLNYHNDNDIIQLKTITNYMDKLVAEKKKLEKDVEYLTWLKLITKRERKLDSSSIEYEKTKEYCELLRTHLKDLVEFMKEMLKGACYSTEIEHKQMMLDFIASSKLISKDLVQALEDVSPKILSLDDLCKCQEGQQLIQRQAAIIADELQHGMGLGIRESAQSDSETFSEPDRSVSLARMGLPEMPRPQFFKYAKTFSDSEDSMDYIPYHKTYQNDVNDLDGGCQLQELREINNKLYSEVNSLRNEVSGKSLDIIDEKLLPIIGKLEKYQKCCERRIHDGYSMKKEKQNNTRKVQLEKKIIDVENMAAEIAQQKCQLLQFKESNERKTSEMILALNIENDSLRARVKKLEEDNECARENIATLTKDLDRLTLTHSQILVENTKLTNEKLRLEQELRKSDATYELNVRSLQEKFNKDILDLNQVNDTHRTRLEELENANKELRRRVVVCDTSDSAPSSSGVSSVPTESNLKQPCDDILQEFHTYNGSQYWQPISYPSSSGRSKSSCSPDLGIESDAAVSTSRPLKDTLKITESMTNLLSDEENSNRGLRDLDRESPLHSEGLDEVEALKQENEALKRRLMKTRRALEDTFEHLSASNKNKKNVEKAITKQLMITKSILKKTRTYEEPFEN